MSHVFIPPQLRDVTGGAEHAEANGRRLRDVIDALEQKFPGVSARLLADDRLAPGLAVSIDGELATLGLLSPVGPSSEIHFLPALGGG